MSKATARQISKSKSKAKFKRQEKLHTRVVEARQTQASQAAIDAAAEIRSRQAFEANSNGVGYDFWVPHVVNYLASNYTDGVWSPVFPEIYDGTILDIQSIRLRVAQAFLDKDKQLISDLGQHCLLWVDLSPKDMYPLVRRVRYSARSEKGNPHAPHDPGTWGAVAVLGAVISAAYRSMAHHTPVPEIPGETLSESLTE